MKSIYWLVVSLIVSSVAIAGDPSLPGHHPLSQAQAGSLLISELRCAACHTGIEQPPFLEKMAPDLMDVGNRVSPEYLKRFIESPHVAQPDTMMPDMIAMRSESERKTIADALTHFLVSLSKPTGRIESMEPNDRQRGKELFHSVGCVACHGPKEALIGSKLSVDRSEEEEEESFRRSPTAERNIKAFARSLEHVAAKYRLEALSEFLFQPLKVRSSGRMPDMKLTRAESLAIADYLIGEHAKPDTRLVLKEELVERGKKYFQELNCAACHNLPGIAAAPPRGSLKGANIVGGCLSKKADSDKNIRGPRFGINDQQSSAIIAALREEASADSDELLLAKTLTTFRCIACHVRDDYGGVHDTHNPFFRGSELNLGDDGRIPPPLTLMGAKLRPAWLKKVLFDGESVRYYMSTRMPQYGASNLHHLPDLVRRLDRLTGPEMKIPTPENRSESDRQNEKLVRAAGRELLGDKGANCIACHQFNRKGANVNQGIDLLTSYERLQPEWFHRYLRNPGAFRPRTVMPSAWPDGVAAFKTILDGDTNRQIESIWYYLSLGTSAADPSGVRSVSTKIEVTDRAVVYRGRSRIAGFRGIAVGLKHKVSYAFNAETGSISAIWQGDFIGVNWSGQGSGDFNPVGKPIALPQDVSFARLSDENDPWPLMPTMTKEAPVNPNPLYPKNVGYQFRGYYLDESSIPTFQYRSGMLDIEDRTESLELNDRTFLKRVLQFDSPKSQSIWFRALVGDIHRDPDGVFRCGSMRLKIPTLPTKLRAIPAAENSFELLLHLEIPQGKSSLEFQYEPLTK